ncbi:MAG: ABC transporter permease [Saprospiraceae bacterium]
MFKNYIKIAFRSFLKHKLYSFVNIFGLSIGIAFCLLIYLFVRHELSYDHFHENAAQIFRVNGTEFTESGAEDKASPLHWKENKGIYKYAHQPLPLGPKLKELFPEVNQYCRYAEGEFIVRFENKIFPETGFYVDDNFFRFFSFPLKEGNPTTVLAQQEQLVLTEALAEKYFGRTNPVGQTLFVTINGEEKPFTVGGLAENMPANTSVPFQLVLPIQNNPYYERRLTQWGSSNTPLFIELAAGTNPEEWQNKLSGFVATQFKSSIDWIKERYILSEEDQAFSLSLTPLTAIHLDPTVHWRGGGHPLNVLILSSLALLILLIACLNYISLALTGASGRTIEIGMRKVLGARPGQLQKQFWMEAQFLVVLAVGLALVLVDIMLPYFNGFVERNLDFKLLDNIGALGIIAAMGLVSGLIAGGYPAMILARLKPIKALRGNQTYRFKPRFTKIAVVLQYSLAVFLIVSSLTMFQQMRFLNQKDLGYEKDQLIVLQSHTGWDDEGERLMNQLKQELGGHALIKNISGTSASFTKGWDINGYDYREEQHRAFCYKVDHDYIKTLGIEVVAGRDFSTAFPSDMTDAIIVNEALVKDLGLENPIGAQIPWRTESPTNKIVGVVKDFHFLALDQAIQPMLMYLNPDEGKIQHLLLKADGNNLPGAIALLESTWKKIAADKPFDYSFLDQDVAAQYASYERWTQVMGIATIFAIIIASLGLFGLAGMMLVNKTKEIGIRKVLGAGISNLLLLLNREFLILTAIALCIATPLSLVVMRKWLSNFEFKIELNGTVFLVAGLLCLSIILFTVSYHTLKAALTNPVDALKNE